MFMFIPFPPDCNGKSVVCSVSVARLGAYVGDGVGVAVGVGDGVLAAKLKGSVSFPPPVTVTLRPSKA
jgi:hypothetical protein